MTHFENPNKCPYEIGLSTLPLRLVSFINFYIVHNTSQNNEWDELTANLVTDELVEFEDNWLKFKTSGELPITLEEHVEYISNQ